uniref:Galactose oxidase n=2 Tax=Rhizophagus irregularis TaxID=588596 RepID=U9TZW9_RHIID
MVFPNTGIPPQQREGFQAVINNGKIYIFVGSESDAFGKMIIFNLNLQDSIWSLEVNNNPPLARYGYTATILVVKIYELRQFWHFGYTVINSAKSENLLPIKNGESSYTMVTPYSKKGNYHEDHLTLAELNALIKFTVGNAAQDGLIFYIGGVFQDESYANMNEIPMYNTLKDNWSNAKMNPTGKIIPEGRQMHSAVLSKFNTIIVYGGYYYKVSSKPELVILDISNPIYNWIQPITASPLPSLSPPSPPSIPAASSPLSLPIIAIIIPIIIILIIIGFLVYYKRYKKQKIENENNNNNNTNNNSEEVQ